MLRLPTCLLRHQTTAGSHYDWLLAPPGGQFEPAARLWTARVAYPSTAWAGLGRFPLQRIADHRRVYLSYQGRLSDGRGSVIRVDEGWFMPLLWRPGRMVLQVQFRHFIGRVELRRLGDGAYVAALA